MQLDVTQVIQFDFAKSAADYVHRCGRTARAGRKGTVTSLVTKSDLDLVRAIRDAEKRGEDVIAAGEAQQKLQRQQRATELQATPRTLGGGAQASAAFPDCTGISRSGEEQSAERGKNSARGRGSGRGRGGGGGRGKGIKGVSRGISRRSAGSRAR